MLGDCVRKLSLFPLVPEELIRLKNYRNFLFVTQADTVLNAQPFSVKNANLHNFFQSITIYSSESIEECLHLYGVIKF